MNPAALPSSTGGGLVTSRYNFAIPTVETAVVFNALYGSAVRFGGALALAEALTEPGVEVAEGDLPAPLLLELVEQHILVPASLDELAVIAERFARARRDAPIVLTITTTMDCNLGCYYCYEDRSGEALSSERGDLDALIAMTRRILTASGKPRLHVDWYGGEPLLNQTFMEEASPRLRALCAELGIAYRASIISNGTEWPDDLAGFVDRHQIGQAQVTFDGLKANHDRRRHYRREHRGPDGERASTFDRLCALLDRLPDHCRVDIRMNVDSGNADDFVDLVGLARRRGWFDRRFPVAVQPARLMKFSEHSAFMREVGLRPEAFEAVRRRIEAARPSHVEVQNTCAPEGYPRPRTSVCAALARDSVVVGAEGALYRCGLQVGEQARQVGQLARPRHLPVVQSGDHDFWSSFDPTRQPRCHACAFLPVCWSGCPKNHLERDAQAIREQGDYWRANLAALVARGLGLTLAHPVEYPPERQFPDGEPSSYLSAPA